jgi:hypothetical protein
MPTRYGDPAGKRPTAHGNRFGEMVEYMVVPNMATTNITPANSNA